MQVINILADKNHRNPDVFIKIFTLLLTLFIMISNSLKKAKKEPVITLNNEKYQRYDKEIFVDD